jgi:hypothetical protein
MGVESMIVTSPEAQSQPRMAGVVLLYLATVVVSISRRHIHGFHPTLWSVIPLLLAMVCLVYALFKPTRTVRLISVAASAATLIYTLVL